MGSELLPRLRHEDPNLTDLLDKINPLRLTNRKEYAEYIDGCMQDGTDDVWCVDTHALDRGTTCYRLGQRKQPPSEWPLPSKNYWVEQQDSVTFVAYAQEPYYDPIVLLVDADPLTCMQLFEDDLAVFRDEKISTRA